MNRTMTPTIFFFCMAMAFPAFAADKKDEKKKGPFRKFVASRLLS